MTEPSKQSEPPLPEVGEVYMLNTILFNDGDHAEFRPVVIVRAPKSRTDYVTVIQRSSTCFHLNGIEHAKSSELGLNLRGKWIFQYQRSLRAYEFLELSPSLRGSLEEYEVAELLEAWEQF